MLLAIPEDEILTVLLRLGGTGWDRDELRGATMERDSTLLARSACSCEARDDEEEGADDACRRGAG